MRFTTIVTTLSAVAAAGVMSTPIDQPKVGVATEGNVTATVEVVKTNDGIDVARITYTTVDVEHPDKLAPPISRFCWNIGGECLAFNAPLTRALSFLTRSAPVLTANTRMHRGSLSCLGLLRYGRRFLWNQYVTNALHYRLFHDGEGKHVTVCLLLTFSVHQTLPPTLLVLRPLRTPVSTL